MLDKFVIKILAKLEPELAHNLVLYPLKLGISAKFVKLSSADAARLKTRIWGLDFANPLGLAAGFDKNAEGMSAVLKSGLGFTEVGSVTPLAQAGNPKPRLFRLPQDQAVINRMGFNNAGADVIAKRLARFRQKNPRAGQVSELGRGRPKTALGPVGVNIGKNRHSSDALADYSQCVRKLAPLADYLVVNVSSPNTVGLRDLQRAAALPQLLQAVKAARHAVCKEFSPPILVKLSPDLAPGQLEEVADIILAEKIDGAIISNTTTQRPAHLHHGAVARETGGLSGQPLFDQSTRQLASMYRLTNGKVPLIGVGGIASGHAAYAKICAGASLLQLYTALALQGPWVMGRILTELAACLTRDQFHCVADAVGIKHRGKA